MICKQNHGNLFGRVAHVFISKVRIVLLEDQMSVLVVFHNVMLASFLCVVTLVFDWTATCGPAAWCDRKAQTIMMCHRYVHFKTCWEAFTALSYIMCSCQRD